MNIKTFEPLYKKVDKLKSLFIWLTLFIGIFMAGIAFLALTRIPPVIVINERGEIIGNISFREVAIRDDESILNSLAKVVDFCYSFNSATILDDQVFCLNHLHIDQQKAFIEEWRRTQSVAIVANSNQASYITIKEATILSRPEGKKAGLANIKGEVVISRVKDSTTEPFNLNMEFHLRPIRIGDFLGVHDIALLPQEEDINSLIPNEQQGENK